MYPIARGVAPLLVTLGAAEVAGERLTPTTLTGISLVSLGILGLAIRKHHLNLKPTLAALVTGLLIATFTLVDGFGVRFSRQPQSYAAWLFILQGAPMPLIFFAVRGQLIPTLPFVDTIKAMIAGLVSMSAYVLTLWALALSPMGPTTALRETSIPFAVIIGRLFLGEVLTFRHFLSACTIAVGAFIVAAQN